MPLLSGSVCPSPIVVALVRAAEPALQRSILSPFLGRVVRRDDETTRRVDDDAEAEAPHPALAEGRGADRRHAARASYFRAL